ncbi:hypothetical protein [Neorhizobium sp. S3-V5DH]|uniref:hypothetical protein n=1 Tax=Neorhizobium sp. S3-V5DH TaxID=2485166 RepID=UPI001045C9B4|nr:hypothetical protein [Neorhizobium sp. S3-V5DH]
MAALSSRFAVRQERDRSWTVYDTFTDRPAIPSTWCLVDLSESQANIYCAIINAKDANRIRGGLS